MLSIRAAQREAILDNFIKTFIEWTVRYLRESVPEQRLVPSQDEDHGIDEALLRRAVENTCQRGLAAGLEDSRLLLRLILIVASASPAILDDPQATRILDDRSRSGDKRLDELALLAEGGR